MIQARALRYRAIRLVGRSGGVQQQPDRDRAFAFGLAHEEAIRAGVQLPVDLAQFVPGLVGTVLGEFEAGTAAAAGVLADATGAAGQARPQPQQAQARTQFRWQGQRGTGAHA